MGIWDQVEIATDQGEKQTGIAPLIISASRSTDIPAFYAEWFLNRLEQGYCKWINPFNQKSQYISFEKTKAVVFWSKNPKPMMPVLPRLDQRRIGWYFQFTLNDYEAEDLEPHVPPLEERIETFLALSEIAGRHRVIWRFDPLVLTDGLGPSELLEKIARIGNQIHTRTERLVISFADILKYPRVRKNLDDAGVKWREFKKHDINEIAKGIQELAHAWGLKAATCAEPMELSAYGITHNRCIDDELILRVTDFDREIVSLLRYEAGNQQPLPFLSEGKHPMKDKGQRKACGCIVSKDIGQYNTCGHLCVYCYANASPDLVEKNRMNVSREGETILPD
jgi:hypothetical protein